MQRQAELFTQAGVHHPTVLVQQESFSPVRTSPGEFLPSSILAVVVLTYLSYKTSANNTCNSVVTFLLLHAIFHISTGISFNEMVESKGGGGGSGGSGNEEISYWASLASHEVDEELQKAQDSAAEAEDELLLNSLTTKLSQHDFAHQAVADPISPRTKFITSCLHEG